VIFPSQVNNFTFYNVDHLNVYHPSDKYLPAMFHMRY
jgi:hypothetical protein